MHTVYLKPNENIDHALRRLKTKMDSDYVMDEVRARRYFETAAQKSKRKAKALDKKRKFKR
jgi:small subunit ribosomal protein S21